MRSQFSSVSKLHPHVLLSGEHCMEYWIGGLVIRVEHMKSIYNLETETEDLIKQTFDTPAQ